MFRRLLSFFALLVCITPLRAAVWQSQEFGVAVTLPDGPDWVPMPEAITPSVRVLVAVTNERTNSMFNMAVQTALAGKSLNDTAVIETIKKDLTAAGYQIFGYSRMSAGTTQWVQFPMNAGGAKGVVRATGANGQIFTLTILRGDGKNALEDPDLTKAAASFRITGTPATVAGGIAPVSPSQPGVAIPPPPTAGSEQSGEATSPEGKAVPAGDAPVAMDYKRIAIGAGIVIFLMLMVWGIIGSGKK
jgi:hypothetical protein